MRGLKLSPVKGRYLTSVASFTDAWIETFSDPTFIELLNVASFTDAWIETPVFILTLSQKMVASFTDAWIETTPSEVFQL